MPLSPSPCIETMHCIALGKGRADPPAPVIVALSPPALRAVLDPAVSLVLWPRSLPQGTPATARLVAGVSELLSGVSRLAAMFSSLCGASAVRIRLEHVDDDACRCMHVLANRAGKRVAVIVNDMSICFAGPQQPDMRPS